MSDLAIAAVTATLRSVLAEGPGIITVTTDPPDKANQAQGNRLNLFLYHVALNAAWRNQEIPTKVKRGESGFAPLAITLHYMLTAYGDDGAETDHRLLGTAMRVLYDRPLLFPDDIRDIYNRSRLREQDDKIEPPFEAVRLTPEPLTVEEMSKLWTTFQTQYRVSASYQAAAVLLESKKPIRKPLPVLKRGEEDRGANVVPTFPILLKEIEYRDWRLLEPKLPAGQLGDVITVVGERLPGQNASVLVRDPARKATAADPDADIVARLTPEAGSTAERLYVRLDPAAGEWVAGQLELLIEQVIPQESSDPKGSLPPKHLRSQPLSLALAPRISDADGLNAIVVTDGGVRKLIMRCDPPIRRVGKDLKDFPPTSLLLTPILGGDPPAPVRAEAPNPNLPNSVSFAVNAVPTGEFRPRLEIESVETLVMKRRGSVIEFDEVQKVQL